MLNPTRTRAQIAELNESLADVGAQIDAQRQRRASGATDATEQLRHLRANEANIKIDIAELEAELAEAEAYELSEKRVAERAAGREHLATALAPAEARIKAARKVDQGFALVEQGLRELRDIGKASTQAVSEALRAAVTERGEAGFFARAALGEFAVAAARFDCSELTYSAWNSLRTKVLFAFENPRNVATLAGGWTDGDMSFVEAVTQQNQRLTFHAGKVLGALQDPAEQVAPVTTEVQQ